MTPQSTLAEFSVSPDDYIQFVLSVDELAWAKAWLEPGRRCDSLLVFIARGQQVTPRVWIRALESKTRGGADEVAVSPTVAPFDSGIEQVAATLDALGTIISIHGGSQLVEDLRFASFVEHLSSVALSQEHPLEAEDSETRSAFDIISQMSARQLPGDLIRLDGAVVVTQPDAAVEPYVERVTRASTSGSEAWPILLARAGREVVSRLFTDEEVLSLGEVFGEPVAPVSPSPVDRPTDERAAEDDEHYAAAEEEAEAERVRAATPSPDDGAPQADVPEDDDLRAQIDDLFLACRNRDFAIHESDEVAVEVGPSLVSVPFVLEQGESIRPIENALEDLAREIGVPTLDVENHPTEAFHVRFLLPRRNRAFPRLPEERAPILDEESQSYLGLYLGQDISGVDYLSYVSAWPHMLIAGSSGSGKTTFILSLLEQVGRVDASLVDLIVIDGKGEADFIGALDDEYYTSQYPDVVLGQDQVPEVLEWVVEEEVPRRRQILVDQARQSDSRPGSARQQYVESVAEGREPAPFPVLLLVIDEFAEIALASSRTNFEQRVRQVAQSGRSTLVHLVLATQRPDARIIEGAIKTNLDARVALSLPTHHDSMTILGGKGAEKLLGKGDLVFRSSSQSPIRLQGYSPSS